MLQASQVSLSFGQHRILEDVSVKVTTHSRIGLVGANGGGKSTLLKVLMRELTPSKGSVSETPGLRVQCLTQNPHLTHGNTLKQELYSVFTEINDAKAEEARLTQGLEAMKDAERLKALERINTLHETLVRLGAAELDANISRMVTGLGFSLPEMDRLVEHFSGGWQMRINLAKVLLHGADIILMDEPTNHLDMEACEWLENFLRAYSGGIVVVSHDRRFLDEVTTDIIELERGQVTHYSGNYTAYVTQRAEARDRQAAAADRQQKTIAEQMAFVDRFRASATKSKQAKSREKQLAKIERIEAPQGELKRMSVRFPLPEPSGRDVLQLKNVAKAFGNHKLFKDVNATLEWVKDAPQRVFILGPNGCGKTTLFNMLMGHLTADSGEVVFGNRVKLGYYAQHQLQILDPTKTAYETLEEAMPASPMSEIRGILGRFLFTGEQSLKSVDVLSGGEKGRLALAKLLVTGPNTLLLDEPTNHLDIPAQEAVEAAIQDYQGTVLCISHDRYFIQSLATQIWEFDEGRLITFNGTYDEYMAKRDLLREISRGSGKGKVSSKQAVAVAPNPEKERQQAQQLRKAIKQLEKQIKQQEKLITGLSNERDALETQMALPSVARDFLALDRISLELEAVQAKLSTEERTWEELSQQLTQLDAQASVAVVTG
jgi:ATP-binding cassette, subfamily F, member 3